VLIVLILLRKGLTETCRYRPVHSETICLRPVSATFGGHTATLTGGFDFQRENPYYSIATIALHCNVSDLEAWDRQTDRRADGRTDSSVASCPHYTVGRDTVTDVDIAQHCWQ